MIKLHWSVAKRLVRLRNHPRIVSRLGARWMLDPHDWIDLQLLIHRPYEVLQRRLFIALCQERHVTRFIDCGANIGLYTVLMAKNLPDLATIDAFEPVLETRYRLCTNLWLNDLAERVTVHPCGLSDRQGPAEIMICASSSGTAAIAPSEQEQVHRAFKSSRTIDLQRLDDLIPISGASMALKIDVEGHEHNLIAGAERVLRENACVVQIELRERNRVAAIDHLRDLGYERVAAVNDDLFFVPAAR